MALWWGCGPGETYPDRKAAGDWTVHCSETWMFILVDFWYFCCDPLWPKIYKWTRVQRFAVAVATGSDSNPWTLAYHPESGCGCDTCGLYRAQWEWWQSRCPLGCFHQAAFWWWPPPPVYLPRSLSWPGWSTWYGGCRTAERYSWSSNKRFTLEYGGVRPLVGIASLNGWSLKLQ